MGYITPKHLLKTPPNTIQQPPENTLKYPPKGQFDIFMIFWGKYSIRCLKDPYGFLCNFLLMT